MFNFTTDSHKLSIETSSQARSSITANFTTLQAGLVIQFTTDICVTFSWFLRHTYPCRSYS